MAQVWAQHTGLASGPVQMSQEQFDQLYSPLGWTITDAPTGNVGRPASELLHYAGDWQPNTQYQANDVVTTPGGGLLRFYQQQLTDITFSESGGRRLTNDPGTESGPILAF